MQFQCFYYIPFLMVDCLFLFFPSKSSAELESSVTKLWSQGGKLPRLEKFGDALCTDWSTPPKEEHFPNWPTRICGWIGIGLPGSAGCACWGIGVEEFYRPWSVERAHNQRTRQYIIYLPDSKIKSRRHSRLNECANRWNKGTFRLACTPAWIPTTTKRSTSASTTIVDQLGNRLATICLAAPIKPTEIRTAFE